MTAVNPTTAKTKRAKLNLMSFQASIMTLYWLALAAAHVREMSGDAATESS